MMQGLDASFDAVFFVSYHGSMASEASTLSHTYNPRAIARVLLNGIEVGESGINSLVALGHGVPGRADHRRRHHRRGGRPGLARRRPPPWSSTR